MSEEETYSYEDEDKTPVDTVSIEEILSSEDEVTPVVIKWWNYLFDYLLPKLNDQGLKTHLSYDVYMEPNLMIWWDNETLAHITVSFGEEDNGDKFGYYYLAVQGAGGICKYITDFTPTGVEAIYYDTLTFMRMIKGIKNLSPHQ